MTGPLPRPVPRTCRGCSCPRGVPDPTEVTLVFPARYERLFRRGDWSSGESFPSPKCSSCSPLSETVFSSVAGPEGDPGRAVPLRDQHRAGQRPGEIPYSESGSGGSTRGSTPCCWEAAAPSQCPWGQPHLRVAAPCHVSFPLLLQLYEVSADTKFTKPSDAACDVACLIYDLSDPRSFSYCASIYKVSGRGPGGFSL